MRRLILGESDFGGVKRKRGQYQVGLWAGTREGVSFRVGGSEFLGGQSEFSRGLCSVRAAAPTHSFPLALVHHHRPCKSSSP